MKNVFNLIRDIIFSLFLALIFWVVFGIINDLSNNNNIIFIPVLIITSIFIFIKLRNWKLNNSNKKTHF